MNDENILEVGEVDAGLIWARAGHAMWLEPASVVHYQIDAPIAAEDIRLFDWRWNMRSILEGYRYFERKWGFDITEQGRFQDFLFHYNRKLGLFPRLFPSAAALRIERAVKGVGRLARGGLAPLRAPQWAATNLKAWWIGYYDWGRPTSD